MFSTDVTHQCAEAFLAMHASRSPSQLTQQNSDAFISLVGPAPSQFSSQVSAK